MAACRAVGSGWAVRRGTGDSARAVVAVAVAAASPANPRERRVGRGRVLITDQGAAAILSPDGSLLAFVAQKDTDRPARLYIRRLDHLLATPLAGTDEASNPFFSPDGQWIAFFAGGKLKKVSVTGGAVVSVCDAPTGRGGGGPTTA